MKRRIYIITTIIIIVFIMAAALIGKYVSSKTRQNTPQKTLESFEKSFKNNDINGMIQCLTPESQEYAYTFIEALDEKLDKPISLIIDFMPFLSKFFDIDQVTKIRFVTLEEEKIEDDSVRILGKLELSQPVSIKVNIQMTRIKNRWYIKSIVPKLF